MEHGSNVTRAVTIISLVLMMATLPVSALKHLDTTYQDFYDDGDPSRFVDTIVVNGSVELDVEEGAWTQTDWVLGPGNSVWNGQNGFHSGDAMEYNTSGEISLWPRYGQWERLSDVPFDLTNLQIVWAGDRYIMTGGLGSSGMSKRTYAYFIETDTWQIRASSTIELLGHASAWNGHHVYVMGDSGFPDSMYRYDKELNSWETLTSAPIKRTEHTMVAIDEENLLVLGGKNETGVAVDELWNYNITTETWVQLRSASKAMYGQCAVWDNSSKLMIVTGGKGQAYLWDSYAYDPKDDLWTELEHLPTSRVDHSMVWSPEDDRMIVFGGEGGGYLDDLYIYDLGTDLWTNGAKEPGNRAGHSAAWGSEGMLVVGGQNGNGYLNETWIYRYFENRTEGWFTSSQVDIGHNVDFIGLNYEADIPQDTRIEVQLASNTDHQTWDYLGPDGTASTRFLVPSDVIVPDVHDGNRYFKFKVFLKTTDINITPVLGSMSVTYKSYRNPGHFISRAFDLKTDGVTIDSIYWDATIPSGTEIKMYLTSSPHANMTDPTMFNRSVGQGAMISENTSRYLRYEAKLVTMNTFFTPVLEAVHINYSSAPRLHTGSVEPSNGIYSTIFNYSVEYIDLDGRPPSFAQVVIDGVAFDMATADSDLSNGGVFRYSTTLSNGNHNYYYNYRVANINLRLPSSGTYSGPTVKATNLPPEAVITLPSDGEFFEHGQNIVLRGDKSSDPDGDILTYNWSSNMTGLISVQPFANVSTLTIGKHIIALTVMDPVGGWDRAYVNITILPSAANHVPVIIIAQGDFVKEVGEMVIIDASKSYDDDGSIVRWSFDWGDGSNVTEQGTGLAGHTYDKADSYLVTITVRDNKHATNVTKVSVIIEEKGKRPEPPPPDYTTTIGGQLTMAIAVIVIIVCIVLALYMARRSKY